MAAAWIRLSSKKHVRGTDPDIDSLDFIRDYIEEDPDQAVLFIEKVLEKVENKNLIGNLGAGPLEDLLGSIHGKAYVERVIARARQDKKWRLAFGCVWTSSFKDRETAAKIERALDVFFPNGRL